MRCLSNNIGNWLDEFHDLNPLEIQGEDMSNKKAHKLDLFSVVLPALDKKDKNFYRNLSKEEQDSIEPWILMRWMTSVENDQSQPHYLLTINDFVNNNFSSLAPKKSLGLDGHKELQWMLLALCGTGKSPRRKFLKPGKGLIKNKLEELISSFFPLMKDDELDLYLKINTRENIEQLLKDNGYDNKFIKDLLDVSLKKY